MKLEEEIKQSKFKNDYQKLAVNILFTHGWLMSFQKKIFEEFDLTTTQYNILRILRGQSPNPISINLLKERMLDKMSDTSRLIERLRKKDLVDRKICKNDRRKSDVKITEKGLELLKKLDDVDEKMEKVLSNLSKQEVKTMNLLLDKMRG
jgi:DNA-binding MarR family transcriptional regulator